MALTKEAILLSIVHVYILRFTVLLVAHLSFKWIIKMDIFTSFCFHVFGSIPGCLYVSPHFLTEVTLPVRVGLLSSGKQSLIHP